MFEQYIKLLHLEWIDLWVIEAVITIVGAVVLALILNKIVDCLDQLER